MGFTYFEVGQPCPPILKNVEKYRGFSGAKLEVDENGSYMMFVFLDQMTDKEIKALKSGRITFKTMEQRDTGFLLTLVGLEGNLQFEIIFDPTLYNGANSDISILRENNQITLVGIDTRTMIIKALRIFAVPQKLREIWLDSWDKMIKITNCNYFYMQWINSLYRFSLKELYKMAIYEGKIGE